MFKSPRLSKTVLLVGDGDDVRRMIGEFLESWGMQVLQASSAKEAIQSVLSFPGPIDLLLTDIEMPGMDGLELAKEVATLKPGVRIVYMSGGKTPEDWRKAEGLQTGSLFLQEPFRMDELKTLISSTLAVP